MSEISCAGVQRFVDAYLDEEFAEADRVDFERHVTTCESCRRKVQTQARWKQVIRQSAPHEVAPAHLRAALSSKLGKELGREELMRRWTRRLVPALSAAAMVVAYFAVPQSNMVNWSPVTADVIASHQRNMPLEIAGESDQVKNWYAGKVDFPVRPPAFGNDMQRASLRGGRLANIRERQAAYLVYDVDGSRVSVFIFSPQEMPFAAKRRTHVGDRDVFLDQESGYNVAVYEDRGVGYAIASEMDEAHMLRLVSAAVSR